MAFDVHKNAAWSLVATAPSPATSGGSLVVTAGEGARFPTGPFTYLVCPANAQPMWAAGSATGGNFEMGRATISGNTMTLTARAQFGTTARSIQVGDQIFIPDDAKLFTDIEQAVGPVIPASYYGTDPTGTVSSSTAINNAIADLPVTGGTVDLGFGDFKIGSPLNIGDGSASACSTRTGVMLQGGPAPAGIGPNFTGVTRPDGQLRGVCRLFSGAATNMLNINGPLNGWGVRNIDFDGAGIGLIGLNEIACEGGNSSGCMIRNFTDIAQKGTSRVNFGSVIANHMGNRYENFHIVVPKINNAKGIFVTGNGVDGNSNSCFNTWDGAFIVFASPPTAGYAMTGVYLQTTDSQIFRNVSWQNPAGVSGGAGYAIVFDYALGTRSDMPWDCYFERPSFGTTANGCFAQFGTPASYAKNSIVFIATANGIPPNPGLSQVNWGATASNP